ncbi:MAG: DUF2130 domain-containing protein [Halobacteriaceae archaeon]
MATEPQPTIQVESNSLVIENLEITDEDVIEYISEREDKPPEEIIRLALRVGVSTLRLSETTEDMEYVRHEFDKINTEFQDKIEALEEDMEEWFDEEDGDFANIIENTFGKDGDVVDDVFDHTNDDTPMQQLYSDIEEELEKIREKIVERDTRQAVEQQTTIKGENFEDDLDELLAQTIRKADELQRTGEKRGQLDDRFVGDFVITLGETNQDILIEAKNVSNLSKPQIREELEEGIQNRGADYGILVLKNEEAASNYLGAFREFDQQMLYVAISDEETEEYDTRLLNLAYEWARMRTLSSQLDSGDDVDIETIQTKVNEVEDAISNFQNIRTQCTNIRKARDKIEKKLDSIEDDIEDDLDAITREIQAVGQTE